MQIKELRTNLKMSVEEMAVEIGASYRSIGTWEAAGKEITDATIGRAFRANMAKMLKRVKKGEQ